MRFKTFIAFIVVFPQLARAAVPPVKASETFVHQAKLKKLSEHKTWLRLVHYKSGWLGGLESQADGIEFFLAGEKGKEDPEAELSATIEGFFKPLDKKDDANLHPRCVFPARYQFLKKALGFDETKMPQPFCIKQIEFKESVAAKSVTLVFSSYYLNNPASAFGHSLLRLNKADAALPGRRFELLDNGVNYAAVVTNNNPIAYAFMGVFGMFHGTFTRVPYYYKVREYNDFESRDMWDYDLNLNPEQVETIVNHIWEVGNTYFDYYYLDENCSYHMLTILETALSPDVDLSAKLPYVVVPADTVKVVSRFPGLVAKVNFRPSLRVQFEKRIAGLSSEAIHAVDTLAQPAKIEAVLANFDEKDKVAILDAAIDYVDVKNFKHLITPSENEASRWKQQLLVTRSQIRVPSQQLEINTPLQDIPHMGHDIRRIGVEGGAGRDQGFLGINFRYALHDLLDPKQGYPEYAQLEFLNTKLRYWPKTNSLWIDELTLFRVTSLSPWSTFNQQVSWRVKMGMVTVRDRSCNDCVAGNFEVGGGLSANLWKGTTVYLLTDSEVSVTPKFDRSFIRLGIGPELGVRVRASSELVGIVGAAYRYRFFTDHHDFYKYFGELRYAPSTALSIGLRGVGYPDEWETALGVYYYF